MNLSHNEKSLWISLVSTVLLFGYYFLRAFNEIFETKNYSTEIIALFIKTLILIIIVNIISNIIISVYSKKAREEASEGDDERDRLIKTKGTRISYYFLMGGVWIVCLNILFIKTTFIMANILLFFIVLAEVFNWITQLIYYRKGV